MITITKFTMNNQIPTQMFARVQNNVILEHPLTFEEIKKSNLPISFFKAIQYPSLPEVPPFYQLKEIIQLKNSTPVVEYSVVPLSLQEVLNESFLGLDTSKKDDYSIEDFPEVNIKRLFELMRLEVKNRLNGFARTRFYDDIATLVTYKDDPDTQLSLEGLTGLNLRSKCWASQTKFEASILNNTTKLPKSFGDLFKTQPELKW